MISLQGELSFATVPALLRQAAPGSPLDLAGITRADSAGISLLLEFTRRAQRNGNSLRLLNASAQVRGLAQFFGVDSLLNFE